MPWPFGPDCFGSGSDLGSNASNLNRLERRAKWRGRRRATKGAPSEPMRARHPAAAPVLFESFEPRLLLSGVPAGTVLASSSGAADFLDIDGTKVTATLSGPGQWQFIQGSALPSLTITGTDATSSFSISGAGGDGRVMLEGVTLQGPLAIFSAPTTDPVSGFSLGGPVQTIVLGNVRDMVLSSSAAIGSIAVASWQSTGKVANGITAPSVQTLASAGLLHLDLNLSGLGQALGSVLANGALTGGVWQVAGDVGSISARSIGAGWTGDVAGDIGVVQTTTTFAGTLATGSLGVLRVGGNFIGGHLMVGAALGADGRPGGTGADADSYGAGYLGQLRVAGAMIGARVHVGVDPVNGVYDDGDDLIIGGAASRIHTMLIGGRIDSTSRIVAGVLPPQFFAGGRAFTPATAPQRLSTRPGDSAAPSLAVALANDTGLSASDRITADPAMTGSARDAGGIAVLRGGLDTAAAGDFVDLLTQLQPDGSFALSANDMAALAGGTLTEGPHVLHLLAVDTRGNARSLDFNFTFSNTQITLALGSDTGASASDGITKDYAIAGKATSGVGVASVAAALDAKPGAAVTLAVDGSFSFSKAQIDTLAGGALTQGAHVLRLTVQDKSGIVTARDLSFSYDVTAPGVSGLSLSASSDTGTLGDNITAAARVSLVGVSEAGVVATLAGASALTASNGGFQFADIVLANGDNTLEVVVTDLAGNTASSAITVNRSGTLATDAALTWNQATLEAVRKSSMYPETATRIMAMVAIAQFDTLAAIEGTAAFLVRQTAAGPVHTELALARAAHAILHFTFPNQRTSLDAILAAASAAVPEGASKVNALALGAAIGQAVLDIRASDGSANFVDFGGSDMVGVWRPTGPTFEVAEEPQWAELAPFAMDRPDQFLPPPPPDLDSAEYAAAVNEVKALGAATGSTRTADQAQQAQFWADGRGSYTPPGHWNQIAQQIALAQGNSLAANVRLFAQLNVAAADNAIAAWNAKYTYRLWRPIDAIQRADLDGNGATTKDADWQPLLITPPHPEYVSGHSSFSNAAAAVLRANFGDVGFTTTSVTLANVSRTYATFQAAADEAGRSRIYGGIHFEFSNTAGKLMGERVAATTLARFNLAQDTQGPSVVAAILPGVSNANVVLRGQVLDNLSGVAAAQYSIDGGPAQALTLDGQGRYTITTAFALDGTADALHSIIITAQDTAGNDAKPVVRNVRLDTRLPVLTLASIAEADTITSTTRLAGTASPTGSTLRGLSYSFDGGTARAITFDNSTGAFDAALNLGALDIGAHTLRLTATDAAGNAVTATRAVTLAALAPFRVNSLTPFDGTSNVGSTQRPELRFSRAVKPESLTEASFYATNSDGTKLAASIVPAQDGSYAWLFLDAPMPGGATITIHVDGGLIRAAADGAFLDADGNGAAGGALTASFTTVSLTAVAGTTLRGRVVDPGADLLPMTFDDMRRGPDGVIHTPDDLFLNPIAHAKVYLLGREANFVFTDADGFFQFNNLPAGNVKVAVDGRTATNAPVGVFWPEMVMDAALKPGVANTLMDSMGSEEERAANAGRTEVYLPRVQTTIFSLVSNSAPTTVGVDQNSAPNLTDAQRNAMTLTVAPGSIIGADGQPLINAEIGISTVPPQLVRDMLPPGVLQHTFDITIQAPGAATFTTPAVITFPNVFNAEPGTKLNVLSFDHTTGMLVINGTATVSEDGLTIVSDEGAGVRAPGWHGVTPPGGCNPSGGAPPGPVPESKTEKVTDHGATALTFLSGDKTADNFKGFIWNAPATSKDVPPLPPIPGCEVPPHNPDTKQQPFLNVTIEVDGYLGDFAKPIGGSLDLRSQSFTLSAGTGVQKKFNYDPKTYAEMFTKGQGFADLDRDKLYGAKIKITEIRQLADGTRTRDIYTYYENRWVDVVDANNARTKTGTTMAFFRANTDAVVRESNVDLLLPSTVSTTFEGGAAPFTLAGSFKGASTLVGKFDPDKTAVLQSSDFKVTVSDTKGPLSVGTITTIGTSTAPTKISIDEAGYMAELQTVILSLKDVWFPSAKFDAKTGTYTGQPGKDGFDDDKNGFIDDATEYGFAGTDDVKITIYSYPTGSVPLTVTMAGKDGKAGTADDEIVYTWNGGAVQGGDFNRLSDNALKTFAGFLPSNRGVGLDKIAGTIDDVFSAAQLTALKTEMTNQATLLKTAVMADYKDAGATYYIVVADNASADVTMSWKDLGSGLFGEASYDSNEVYLRPLLALRDQNGVGTLPLPALQWALAETLNNKVKNNGTFAVGINLNWTSGASFAEYMSNTVAHELAHTFGLNDSYLDLLNAKGNRIGSKNINPLNDIMRAGGEKDDNLTFAAINSTLLKLAVGAQDSGDTPLTNELKLYRNNINLPNKAKGERESVLTEITPEIGVVRGGSTILPGGSVAFGRVAADGPAGALATFDLTITNVGFETLSLDNLAFADGGKGFSIVSAGVKGATLGQSQKTTLTLAYDPATIGDASDVLTITSNAASVPQFQVILSGTGISPAPQASATAAGNNFGGMLIGAPVSALGNIFTISNLGAAPLALSSITLVDGAAEFALLGVPLNLGTTPLSLGLGETFSFGIDYSPSALGLQRAVIEVVTNDPGQKVLRLGAVGTGVTTLPTAAWGRDYVGIQVSDPFNPPALNAVSDDKGFFSFFLASKRDYHMAVFDPSTGLVAHDYGRTAASGKGVDLTASLVFGASLSRDSDFDGLPDDLEFAIGSNPLGRDTDRDGLDDYTEIRQGLDVLGGLGLPVGVVSAAAVKGSAEAVTVVGSTTDSTRLTAFVATGEAGLAVVDVSKFSQPTVLAELDLAGTSTRIAVDGVRGIALLAAGTGGLHFVNVATPATPTLLRTESFTDPVNAVALRDGSAYVATGGKLLVMDVATGDLRQTLDLAGGVLLDVVVGVDGVYTLDSLHVVRTLSVTDDVLIARGAVTLPDGGRRMTVGNGIAYIAAGTGGTGGFLTVNVSNLDAPVLLSGVDDNSLAGGAMALNGSGLGLLAGGINFVFGGFKGVDLVDVSDPQNTGGFITRFNLPDIARDVSIANGVGFVADGTGGLQVINYRGFDVSGIAPTVSISIDAIDADSKAPGVQVLEGRSVHIVPTVTDDKQVRNVELLVNGKVVLNDPSFPFDLFASVPTIKDGGSTVTVQLRATDTGGNVSLSDALALNVVPDTFAPALTSINLTEGSKRFFLRTVDVVFDEAIVPATINATSISIVRPGLDGTFGTKDDVSVALKHDTRSLHHVLSVTPLATLLPGEYRFTLGAGAVADAAGNALTTAVVRNFSIRPASDMKAASGVADAGTAPSANPGQVIGISVPFDPATAQMTFVTSDDNGTAATVTVAVLRVDAVQGIAYFAVPMAANSGDVSVFGLVGATKTTFADGDFPLQIVPIVTDAQLNYISGGVMNVTLTGYGFIEGGNTEYRFGTQVVTDTAVASGPNVYATYPNYIVNGNVVLDVPLSAGAFGPITVKTAGGTSTAFALNVTGIAGAALSGTPANVAVPSANPGQAVTLLGTGLSTSTDVLFNYRDSGSAAIQSLQVSPVSVSADGTKATLIVPAAANDVFSLRIFGAGTQPLLQIVPRLTSYSLSGGTIYLAGSGFVEGASSFVFNGAKVDDTLTNAGPDIHYATNADNTGAYFTEPNHGLGLLTIGTAGGTSAGLVLNERQLGFGLLRDLAVDKATGAIWLADNASPLTVRRIDPASGSVLQSFALDTKSIGSGSFTGGLQLAPATFTLGATQVPAGSLLVFNANPNTDRVVAIDPANGAVIAALSLAGNFDTTGGVFDPVTGDLFLTDRSVAPHRLVRVSAATGALVSSFDLPFNFGEGGLAIDPLTSNFWYASDQANRAVELTRTGAVVRSVSLLLQGVPTGEVTGLAFDPAGKLLVSSQSGRLYTVDTEFDPAQKVPVLSAIVGTATRGTPASGAQASANAGQIIELLGSAFGPTTQVLFQTRDPQGVRGLTAALPMVVSGDGTRLQVRVPDTATTADVKVSNTAAFDLGGNSYTDTIYRNITLNFTAGSSTAALRFADGGIEDVNNESWGLDNVVVRQGATTIFADNFETGAAKAQWSDQRVYTSAPATFTSFSGRFASEEQVLNLSGLTTGQTYTLSFDLYALDSWDGVAGPDQFQVQADGKMLMNESISNYAVTAAQTIGNSNGLRLQVVPTVTGLSDRPGTENSFSIYGSGFQEAASTITIGGVAIVDTFKDNSYPDVAYYQTNNSVYNVIAPSTLDGPIRVTTEGGFDQIAGLDNAKQSTASLGGITAVAHAGTPSQLGQPSANAGQTITLTGAGLTTSSMVQFDAADATGRIGTVTRRVESVSNNGTQATVVVPALARTGTVRLAGAPAGQNLLVVPVLRSFGGTVAPGNTLLIEATGIVQQEVVVQVDGRAIGNFVLRNIADGTTGYYSAYQAEQSTQQLLSLVLPNGVVNALITVSTAGGTATLRMGVATASTTLTPGTDIGNTLATAAVLNLAAAQRAIVNSQVGDGAFAANDVDLFRVQAQIGDTLRLQLKNMNIYAAVIRVFNDTGTQQQIYQYGAVQTGNTISYGPHDFAVPATGAYYIGVSGGNATYDPNIAGTGNNGPSSTYQLWLDRTAAQDSSLTAIQATAPRGTPSVAQAASANVGQTITLTGVDLVAADRIVFTTIDGNGYYATASATPLAVAANGTSLTVVVPINATTGMVRLAREKVGVLLQIVPTLDTLDMSAGQPFNGGTLYLYGSGFAEGSSSVAFGATLLGDVSRSGGIDVSAYYNNKYTENGTASVPVPDSVPSGPLRVVTAGGSSDTLAISFTGLATTAASGTPLNGAAASANPGQSIQIDGAGLSAQTGVVFLTMDGSGNSGQIIVRPWAVNALGTAAQVVVPSNAATGIVRVAGDQTAAARPLQIVPILTTIDITSVNTDGALAYVTLTGRGFQEGKNAEYRFGTTTVSDGNAATGPDTNYYGETVALRVPLTAGALGAITVRTAGGTSASLSLNAIGLTGKALSGTPANAGLPSANAGQAITLNGAALTTATDIMLRYYESGSASPYHLLLNPQSASADGKTATLIVPAAANGVAQIQILGHAGALSLQIVPTLTSSSLSGTAMYLGGSGFVEAATKIAFAGATVTDTTTGAGPDIHYGNGRDNGQIYLAEPTHGIGTLSVTTAGGTSAPFALNQVMLPYGHLSDLAFDTASFTLWVADYNSPGALRRIDPATAAVLATIDVTTPIFGAPRIYGGLQLAPQSFTLNATIVPAGSLLVFNGEPNADRIIAINPANGSLIASLTLAENYDTMAGVFHPGTGHLFVLDRRPQQDLVLELDPANATVLNSFAAPFNSSYGGMALDPVSGNIWYGTNESNTVVEMTATGVVLRGINYTLQGGESGAIAGLTFDSTGHLLVATTNGRVQILDVTPDFATPKPTLTAINAAAMAGTAANVSVAAANTGQVIELAGTNFNATTEVIFRTRNEGGAPGSAFVIPLLVSPDGTRLQVVVPNQATTADVAVTNTAQYDLGFTGYPDAIFRQQTLSFKADSTTTVLRFADGGLEDISNESWGLDNVKVTKGATTIFSDDFEGAAKPQWSDARIDGSVTSPFTRFSGRFATASQSLTLNGLTVGQSYTLSFDLYALDSWDGAASNDLFQVSANAVVLMRDSIGNYSNTQGQTINASQGVRLQVVPTLTGTSNGRPGSHSAFYLNGTGFMEGASTLKFGGTVIADAFTDGTDADVFGARNDTYYLTAPVVLDGKIRVTTEGGFAEIAGPNLPDATPSLFTAIQVPGLVGGIPSGAGPAANAGQNIVLVGQGFTSNTLVQFQGVDDSGQPGLITRAGSTNNTGTQFTVQVPALARSGAVIVRGATSTQNLLVVPNLRGGTGSVVAGQVVLLEGTGLVASELAITIDGQPATFTLRTVTDGGSFGIGGQTDSTVQQLLSVTVPAGTGAGAVTVTTTGGTATLRQGAQTTLAPLNTVGDVGNTLAVAQVVTLGQAENMLVTSTLGNGANSDRDVDLYRVELTSGDLLRVSLATGTYMHLRVFDHTGAQKAAQTIYSSNQPIDFHPAIAGTYYVGVSGYANITYDPLVAGSGTSNSNSGAYSLALRRTEPGVTRLTGIASTATLGTPAKSAIASANAGQTITLTGTGLVAGEDVIFTSMDGSNALSLLAVTSTSVAVDGTSLTVRVPDSATTGTLRLGNDTAGLVLQVVPVLLDVSGNANSQYDGNYLTLTGRGFIEASSSIQLGASTVIDRARSNGTSVSAAVIVNNYTANARYSVQVPTGAGTGPISVTTVGGTSNVFDLSFTAITATATSGTPANAAIASANPGQTITLTGQKFDAGMDVVFETYTYSGTSSQIVLRPASVAVDGTSVTVVVPVNAVTGRVRIIGDNTASELALQIVPVLSGATISSVSYNGTTMDVRLVGQGFIDRAGSAYTFGGLLVEDLGPNVGPDVLYGDPPTYPDNGSVNLRMEYRADAFGPITVRTAGGTSAAFSTSLTSITATAATGTPANAGEASANPNQLITLNGTGLSTSSVVIMRYRESNSGELRTERLTPAAAAVDGSSATLTIPNHYNGAFTVQMLGSTVQPLLQIVPVVTGYDATGDSLYLRGRGFLEGGSSISLAGATVVDTSTDTTTDIYYQATSDNTGLRLYEPRHGLGPLTVTTAGGTSAPFDLNELTVVANRNNRDIAIDTTSGAIWVSDDQNPAKLHRLDIATGADLQTIDITAAAFGVTNFYGGMQIVPEAFNLNGTTVPVGSLLVINAYPSPDRVVALNPITGAVIATLALANYETSAGLYDPTTNHLFVLDRRISPNIFIEIDPATGAVLGSFNAPINAGNAGMAIDPITGNLWYGSDQSNTIYEITTAGIAVRNVSLTAQGVDQNEIAGLAFDAAGKLWIASTQGRAYRVTI